jgi:hypothetical protein
VTVHNHRHVRFVVRNDNFGGRSECLKNHAMLPNFKVTRSAADAHGPESLAFPDIFIGCNWGICSPDTTLPARVSRVRRAETSWYTRQRASGIWNVAYDIWFNKTPITSGQANGAEIMIWLNAHHFPPPRWAPIVWEDHARYYFVHWRPYRHGVSWNYMQFRRVHPARSVTHLRLEPFMQTAERMGLLKPLPPATACAAAIARPGAAPASFSCSRLSGKCVNCRERIGSLLSGRPLARPRRGDTTWRTACAAGG